MIKPQKGYDNFKNLLLNEVVINILCWVVYTAYHLLAIVVQNPDYVVNYRYFIACLSNITLFYIQSFLTFPTIIHGRFWVGLLAFVVSVLLYYCVVLIYYFSGENYITFSDYYHSSSFDVVQFFVGESFDVIAYSAYGYVYAVFRLLRHKQKKQIKRQIQSFETALGFLKSQINQHFLYNTLNFIYYKLLEQSNDSGDVIVWLSQVVRYSVTDKSPVVGIDQELEQVALLLKLYGFQIGNKTKTKLVVRPNTQGRIPHLSVVSVVYDVIAFNDPDKPINIEATPTDEGNKIAIQFFKKQADFDYQNSPNIRALNGRLAIVYPHQQAIFIAETAEKINITLNLKAILDEKLS